MANKDKNIRCSFCGKLQDKVKRIISGPDGAYICDECIEICQQIIEADMFGKHDETKYTVTE